MNKLKTYVTNNKKKIIGTICVLLVLVWAFWYGGNTPGARGFRIDKTEEGSTTEQAYVADTDDVGGGAGERPSVSPSVTETDSEVSVQDDSTDSSSEESFSAEGQTAAGTDGTEKNTDSRTKGSSGSANKSSKLPGGGEALTRTPAPSTTQRPTTTEDDDEPSTGDTDSTVTTTESDKSTEDSSRQDGTTEPSTSKKEESSTESTETDDWLHCTISINCSTILDNLDYLKSGKREYVPENGVILGSVTVAFEEGETVFDILKRVCDSYGIQLEHSYTPAFGSYYIEGINNLYEFDCGSLSGWMYSVNGWFPNYGCSKYEVGDGDVIKWLYTCQGLGEDVGGSVY